VSLHCGHRQMSSLCDSRQVEPSSHIVGPGASNYTASGVSKSVSPADVETEPTPVAAAPSSTIASTNERNPKVFVAGSLAIDLSCDYTIKPGGLATGDTTMKPASYTSNPAEITQSLGGVGGNVARAAHLIGADVRLCSAIGDDLSGKAALEGLSQLDMSTEGISTLPAESGSRTAQYVAINDSNRDLVIAMADMAILDSPDSTPTISKTFDSHWLPQLQASKPTHLVLDANWAPEHLARWLQAGKDIDAHISCEPVSQAKSTRLFDLPEDHALPVFPNATINLVTPNNHELSSMYTAAREKGLFDRADWWSIIDALGIPQTGARVQMALATNSSLVDQGIPQQSVQLLPFFPAICTKLGAQGVLLTQILPAGDERLTSGEHATYILSRCANGTEDTLGVGGVYMRLFPPGEDVKAEDVVSVNGVGDTFLGALVAQMAEGRLGNRIEEYVDVAQRAAVLTLKSRESVCPRLGAMRLLV